MRSSRAPLPPLPPLTPRLAALWVSAIAVIVATVHIALLFATNSAPSVFDDELAYQKLAQSLGQSGQLALFGKHGLTYSPLYPLLLSPLYAFQLSGTAAYKGALVINCLLFALASLPIYRIARFVLTPGRSVVAVAFSSLAPLMLYSSFVMSENLAYPLFLFAVWATLSTLSAPSVRADAVVLALSALCAAARLHPSCSLTLWSRSWPCSWWQSPTGGGSRVGRHSETRSAITSCSPRGTPSSWSR